VDPPSGFDGPVYLSGRTLPTHASAMTHQKIVSQFLNTHAINTDVAIHRHEDQYTVWFYNDKRKQQRDHTSPSMKLLKLMAVLGGMAVTAASFTFALTGSRFDSLRTKALNK
jgi:hypothetical protein